MSKKSIFLFRLKACPIFRQLQIEEALLRADKRNWCVINEGSPEAIVMGISGQVEQMVHSDFLLKQPVPIIRRFSGGGTVFVDENTQFITFIGNSIELETPCCPHKILDWTKNVYAPVFKGLDFRIHENDYALADKKFGGNAQYLCKDRWLHHSTLLWDYSPQKMECLQMPRRMPAYRRKRAHADFLCRLCDYLPDRNLISERLIENLEHFFYLEEITAREVDVMLDLPHRKATELIETKKYC